MLSDYLSSIDMIEVSESDALFMFAFASSIITWKANMMPIVLIHSIQWTSTAGNQFEWICNQCHKQ